MYVGLYRTPADDDGSATVRILACAHALPAGVSELTAEAQREAEAFQQKAAQHVAALDLGSLESLRPMRVPRGGRTARRSEPTADAEAPRAPASEATPPAPASEPVHRETASPQPSRGRYERLANAFRAASADSARARIAGELIAAQQSEDALERFYSVNAMARVDPAYFRDALRNAARDADRHVSDLARRALEKLSNT